MWKESFREEFKVLKVFYIWKFLTGLSSFIIPYMIIYFMSIGLSLMHIGLIIGVSASAGLLFEVPTGAIADFFGRKNSIICAHIIEAAMLFLIPLTKSLVPLMIFMFIKSAGATLVSGADEAWIVDYLKHKKKEKLLHTAFSRIQSFVFAGAFIALMLAGILLLKIDMKWLWIISASIVSTEAIFLIVFGKEYFKRKKGLKIKQAFVKTFENTRSAAKYTFKHPVLFYLIIIAFFSGLAGFVGILSQPFMLELNLPLSSIGPIFAIYTLIAVVISNFSMIYLKKLKTERAALILSQVALATFLVLLAFITSMWIFIMLFYIFSIFEIMGGPISSLYFQKHTLSKLRATIGSLRHMIIGVGTIFAAPLAGFIADLYSIRVAFIAAAILIIPTIICYLLIKENN